MSAPSSGEVERLLAGRIGLDISSVGPALIARGVHARMVALGLRSRPAYEQALRGSEEEQQSLVEEIVVPESWFFRDDRPFEALAGLARSGWLFEPARPPLSVLSMPCAGGEEPYSIAMTLLETGLPAGRFRVDAVDVSTRALARAIAGVYGPNSFRGPGAAIRPKYFREHSGAFTLDPKVRATVHFHIGNLLDPALLSDRPPFDVVFCRNLLIYLDDESRARAFANLGRLLVDGGLLLLGHADRPDVSEKSPFAPTGDKGTFSFRKVAASPKPAHRPHRKSSSSLPPGEGPGRKSSSPLPPGEGPGVRAVASPVTSNPGEFGAVPIRRRPSPPAPLPEGEGSGKAESPASALDRASALADGGRYDEATQLVEAAIRDGEAGAGAFFLLGLIRQAAGDREKAEAHFLKAVYLDAQHDEALLALALLARRKGDVAAEAGYRRRAERVLARKGAS